MENTINNGYETETNNIVILKTDVLTGKEMLFPFRGILISPFIYAYFLRVLDI